MEYEISLIFAVHFVFFVKYFNKVAFKSRYYWLTPAMIALKQECR